MDAGLGIRIALHADRLARTFARAGVGLGALTAHWQSTQMADATVAFDTLQALQVHAEFAAQIAFDDILASLDRVHDLGHLVFIQVFGADARVDLRAFEDLLRIDRADAVNVAERNVDALLAGNINT